MNKDIILLTPEEKEQLHQEFEETVSSQFVDGATKKAQLNLLYWLVKNKYVKGHEEWRGSDFHGTYRCKPDCRLCILEKKIKEG